MPPRQKWRAAEGWCSHSRRKAMEVAGLLSALSLTGQDWGREILEVRLERWVGEVSG